KMLPMAGLGAAGLFPAFAAAIFAVETLHAFARRQWGIKLSGGAPEVVVRSFAALLPSVTCVVLVWFVVHVLGIDLASGITAIVRPLIHGGDSLAAVVIVVLIDSALWLVGVHGVSVLAAVRPLWLAALAENMAAASAGQSPPHVFTQEFFIWFVWQGGSGTTLAFALLLLFARSKQLRLVGKAGIVPAIFNINEPLLFGAPVVMNGKLAPPFIAAPIVLVVLSWCAMHFGVVRPPYIEVVWTLPAPVGRGNDLRERRPAGANAELPAELVGRLAGDADPAVVHALQVVRRAEADEVFRLVPAARRAELDVVGMRSDATAARDLAEPA